MFGAGQQRQRRSSSGSMPGSDLKVRLKLTLEEISTGIEKKLKIKKWKTCETCGGSGARSAHGTITCPVCNGAGEIRQVSRSVFGQFVNITTCQNCGGEGRVIKEPCLECKGDGRIQGDTTIKVNIPAGVSEGNYIPLRGAGNVGRRGGSAGDIIVVIEEEQHAVFERTGEDVLVNLWISFPEAALGTEIEVPTLSGRSKLKIEAGTQSGRLLRMRDRGIPRLNAFGRGDQIVRIQVFVPESLTSQEKTLLKQLAQFRNITPGGGEENKEDGILARVKKVFSS
jgi:molecular chaperone DnaJ